MTDYNYSVQLWEHFDDTEPRVVEQVTVGSLHEVGALIDDFDNLGKLEPPYELRLRTVESSAEDGSSGQTAYEWTEMLGSASDGTESDDAT